MVAGCGSTPDGSQPPVPRPAAARIHQLEQIVLDAA
jgi:hypothetical protein